MPCRNQLKKLSDQELVEHYQSSQELQYIGELYLRYRHLVFGLCLKYLDGHADNCHDLSMAIFEKVITTLPGRQIRKFAPWLAIVARNECISHLRRQKSQQKRQQQYHKNISEKPVENEGYLRLSSEATRQKQAETLTHQLKKLSYKQQRCLTLFYFEGLTYKQINQQTGFTLKEVKSHLQNGKRKLKKWLDNKPLS